MINSYLSVTVIAEWCTFIASLLLLDKNTTYWRWFKVLLFLVLCTETTGWYLYHKLNIYSNAIPFNVLMIVSNLFFMYILSRAPEMQTIRNWIIGLAAFFLVFALINLFFFQGFNRYNAHSESLADIMISLLCCYFLFTIIREEKHINLVQSEYFWLVSGLLLYSFGSALVYQFSDTLYRYYEQTGIEVGNYINYSLNLILYSSLIIAFVCRRKATR